MAAGCRAGRAGEPAGGGTGALRQPFRMAMGLGPRGAMVARPNAVAFDVIETLMPLAGSFTAGRCA
jgi:hypothetical protein